MVQVDFVNIEALIGGFDVVFAVCVVHHIAADGHQSTQVALEIADDVIAIHLYGQVVDRRRWRDPALLISRQCGNTSTNAVMSVVQARFSPPKPGLPSSPANLMSKKTRYLSDFSLRYRVLIGGGGRI